MIKYSIPQIPVKIINQNTVQFNNNNNNKGLGRSVTIVEI